MIKTKNLELAPNMVLKFIIYELQKQNLELKEKLKKHSGCKHVFPCKQCPIMMCENCLFSCHLCYELTCSVCITSDDNEICKTCYKKYFTKNIL